MKLATQVIDFCMRKSSKMFLPSWTTLLEICLKIDDKGKEQMLKLKKKFDLFLKEMPVVGFNSSRYDVNVIKRFLFRHLESSEEDGIGFVVKRNNAYMCIKTERLKFLDITKLFSAGL